LKGTAIGTSPVPPERGRNLLAIVMVACSVGASAAGLTVACIPDLPADEPPIPPPPGCGDGYIDLDAGEQCDPGTGTATAGCRSNCTMQCQSLVWSRNNHCYQLAAPQPFQQGAGSCQASGAHLVTFASEDEFNEVVQYFILADAGPSGWPFWVGLDSLGTSQYTSVKTYEPGWSPQCAGCYAHTPAPSQPLPRAPFSEGGIVQDCVVASSDPRVNTWEQFSCKEGSPRALCEREPAGVQWKTCEAGVCIDLVWTRGMNRYVYVNIPASGDDAELACEALGGSLVVLQSSDEREQLWLQLSKLPTPPMEFWIGLSQGGDGEGGAPSWIWEDHTPADEADAYAAPWAVNEPKDGGSPRAFLFARENPKGLDDTLALNSSNAASLPYVCQVAP